PPVPPAAARARPQALSSLPRPPPRWGPPPCPTGEEPLPPPSDNRRSLDVPRAGGHARGSLPNGVPLRKRAASRADQPYRPRRSAECPRRNGECLPLLFRRLRAQRRPLDARLHGLDRPVPQVDRLSVPPAQRSHDLGPNVRRILTSSRAPPPRLFQVRADARQSDIKKMRGRTSSSGVWSQ